MFRRFAAACALIALAVLAVGGGLPAEERSSPEEVAPAVTAAGGAHGGVGWRRLRSRRGPAGDRRDGIASSDEVRSRPGLGVFPWLWLPAAARLPSPPASATVPVAAAAPSHHLLSPALATRSSRGPPARS